MELKKELAALSEKIERKKKIKTMLTSLEKEEHTLVEREVELKSLLSSENTDVERLEKTTATSILYALLGKKDEKLEKEQREAYAAKLKYDAVVRQLDDCYDQITALHTEERTLLGCEQRYAQVFAEIQALSRNDSRYAQKLSKLESQLGVVSSQLREIDEAKAAGNACMGQIEVIQESLDDAEGWGTFDILGGGLISDIAKHSSLDEAQAGVEQLQVLLNRFHTELIDVKIDAQMEPVTVEGFLRFADYFFDGLIADWSVLSHINDSQESVDRVKGQVSSILSRLAASRATYESEKTGIEKEIEAVVRSA